MTRVACRSTDFRFGWLLQALAAGWSLRSASLDCCSLVHFLGIGPVDERFQDFGSRSDVRFHQKERLAPWNSVVFFLFERTKSMRSDGRRLREKGAIVSWPSHRTSLTSSGVVKAPRRRQSRLAQENLTMRDDIAAAVEWRAYPDFCEVVP